MENISLILQKILEEKEHVMKEKLIENFQNSIWMENKINENDPFYEILNELAYDLEFYEADPNLRDESSYGDERLEQEIKEALRKIEEIKARK